MRDYEQERRNYHGKPEQMARNAARKRARRAAIKAGVIKENDPRDIHHRGGSPLNNALDNLVPRAVSANRSFARTSTARKKNPRD